MEYDMTPFGVHESNGELPSATARRGAQRRRSPLCYTCSNRVRRGFHTEKELTEKIVSKGLNPTLVTVCACRY